MAATQFAVLEGRNLVKSYSIVAIYDIAYKTIDCTGMGCMASKQIFLH